MTRRQPIMIDDPTMFRAAVAAQQASVLGYYYLNLLGRTDVLYDGDGAVVRQLDNDAAHQRVLRALKVY